jgi:hypothetical protein
MEELYRASGVKRGEARDWEIGAEDRFWTAYGMPWRFNQAVGWLRLYRLGFQLRADLWLLHGKRFLRRKAHKQFRLFDKAFEAWIDANMTEAEILAAITDELTDFQREWRHRKLVLDLEAFHQIAPCVRWRQLMDAP